MVNTRGEKFQVNKLLQHQILRATLSEQAKPKCLSKWLTKPELQGTSCEL